MTLQTGIRAVILDDAVDAKGVGFQSLPRFVIRGSFTSTLPCTSQFLPTANTPRGNDNYNVIG